MSNSTNTLYVFETESILKSFSIIFMCLIDTSIICGNGILVAAVLTSRCLRRPTYYFIASLTVSDLAVGILVLPFFIDYLNKNGWIYNEEQCRFWMASHICLCTASIYNLIAISFDRFLAVTRPLTYKVIMTPVRAKSLIGFVWVCAFIVSALSVVPIWSEPLSVISGDKVNDKPTDKVLTLINNDKPRWLISGVKSRLPISDYTVDKPSAISGDKEWKQKSCSMKNFSREYAVFTMWVSFYIPILVLICVYVCIYRTTRRVRLNQHLGQLDLISLTSVASQGSYSVSGSNGVNGTLTTLDGKQSTSDKADKAEKTDKPDKTDKVDKSFRTDKTSKCEVKNGRKFGLAGLIDNNDKTDKTDNEIKPRVKSPVLLRVHKGKYHRHSSVVQQKSLPKLSPPLIPLPPLRHLARRLQSEHVDGLAILLAAPRRSISACVLDGLPWQRSRENSQGSAQSEPMTTGQSASGRPWLRLEHDFWLRMAVHRKRFGSHVSNMWSPRKEAIQRYQEKMTFELRALKTFGLVTLCFLACWLGFCLVNTYDLWSSLCSSTDGYKNCAPDWLLNLVTGLGYVNSAVNPFIYGLSNRKFRLAFRRLMKYRCCKVL